MTNQRFGRPASRPSPPRARVPLPSMHYEHHGIMADGSYRIPLDHNPNEFVNMEFGALKGSVQRPTCWKPGVRVEL